MCNNDYQAKRSVHFYNRLGDSINSKPYAILDNKEVTVIQRSFENWADTLIAYPQLVALWDDNIPGHIDAATSWRRAIDNAVQDRSFPFVILPEEKYHAAMSLLNVIRQMEASLKGMIEQENYRS